MDRPAVKSARIMVVDDQPVNVRLLERLLEVSGFTEVVSTTDSSAVVSLCAEAEPDLIVLDLQMPDPDGFEVMGMLSPWIRGATPLPVLVTTGDISSETKRRALAAGARDFLTKPFDPPELVARIQNLLEARLLQLELHRHARQLQEALGGQARELERAGTELLEPLAFAAEYRDEDPREHTLRVGRASTLLARELALPDEEVELIGRAARLHDVGKIGLSDAVLLKPGRYTPEEFELMKSHAAIGAEILGRGRSRLSRLAAEIARTHHERWDGSGYPDGLRGEEIPMGGRIVALADTFDALTQPRSYREARPLAEAVDEIRNLGGRDFDPRVVSAFEALDHEGLVAPGVGVEPAA
jgi:putative two-component system response regulator